MKGAQQQPRRGHPVSWVSGLYPSLPVYVKGEWIRGFESQIVRRDEEDRRMQGKKHKGSQSQSAADAAKLSKGEAFTVLSRLVLRLQRFSKGTTALFDVGVLSAQASSSRIVCETCGFCGYAKETSRHRSVHRVLATYRAVVVPGKEESSGSAFPLRTAPILGLLFRRPPSSSRRNCFRFNLCFSS